MRVKLAISQQLFYMILSNFHILNKSTCFFHCLLNCSWLRPIYNRNSVSSLTVFSARLFYLYYIKSIIYARCQKLLVELTISQQQFYYRILSNLCIFYKFICPFLSSSYLNLVGFGLYRLQPKFCLKLHRIFRVYKTNIYC